MRTVVMLLTVCSLFSSITADLFAELDPDSTLRLVNREHTLVYSYEPPVLVLPEVPAAPGKEEYVYLRPEAAQALAALFRGAADAGHTLYAVSGYRSYALQKSIYTRKVEAVGEKRAMLTVAPPGASEHQMGLAMDINGETTLSKGLSEAFGASVEGQWVYANAHRYGFIVRYPQGKTDITGYAWEPWHLRYVGEEVAGEIFSLDITFEEYHELLQVRRVEGWAQLQHQEGE